MTPHDILLVVHLDHDGVRRLTSGKDYRSCDVEEEKVKEACDKYGIPYSGHFVSMAVYHQKIPRDAPARVFAGRHGFDAVLRLDRVAGDLEIACECDFQHAAVDLVETSRPQVQLSRFYPLGGSVEKKLVVLSHLSQLSSGSNYVEARMFRSLVAADVARFTPITEAPVISGSASLKFNPKERPHE